MYSFFTLNSLSGCGVNKALIEVSITPSRPESTILSSIFNIPSTNIISIVTPRPSIFFTSNTVALKLSLLTDIYFFKYF